MWSVYLLRGTIVNSSEGTPIEVSAVSVNCTEMLKSTISCSKLVLLKYRMGAYKRWDV